MNNVMLVSTSILQVLQKHICVCNICNQNLILQKW